MNFRDSHRIYRYGEANGGIDVLEIYPDPICSP